MGVVNVDAINQAPTGKGASSFQNVMPLYLILKLAVYCGWQERNTLERRGKTMNM
jgi:hypothetical protein